MLKTEGYNRKALAEQIRIGSHYGGGYSIAAKPHVDYLDDHLRKIFAKTIVTEAVYTDRDYSEDYAAYYARCFVRYGKDCRRLHFFKADFGQEYLDKAFSGDSAAIESIQNSYLGFVVVKPLPYTVIGRTCLVPVANSERPRYFECLQRVDVSLCGLPLWVTSLPFQEQDQDVAACATSALWSIFRSTSRTFQHPAPSPGEITAAAASYFNAGRSMPAGDGLTTEQCAAAIRHVGLEPQLQKVLTYRKGSKGEAIETYNRAVLQMLLYAYMKGGIPSLLIGAMYRRTRSVGTTRRGKRPASTATKNVREEYLGDHAVAALGYSPNLGRSPTPFGPTGLLLASSQVDRFYTHDDNVGPFSRLLVDATEPDALVTSWVEPSDDHKILLRPLAVITPLYHKIRVPLHAVIESVAHLDDTIESLRSVAMKTPHSLSTLRSRLVWDIYLTDVQRYKEAVFRNTSIPMASRLSLLHRNMPRFFWVARALSGTQPIFDLLYDATDLLQGSDFEFGTPYNIMIGRQIGRALCRPEVLDRLGRQIQEEVRMEKIARWLANLEVRNEDEELIFGSVGTN